MTRVVEECTTTISREVEGLKSMVDEFTRYARLPHARLEPADLNEVVRQAVLAASREQKWIAAICAAPSILGHMGLLEGRQAVCYPGFEPELTGARLSQEPVCRDGRLITGKGPGAAIEFALALVEALSGADLANRLRVSMQCQPR